MDTPANKNSLVTMQRRINAKLPQKSWSFFLVTNKTPVNTANKTRTQLNSATVFSIGSFVSNLDINEHARKIK